MEEEMREIFHIEGDKEWFTFQQAYKMFEERLIKSIDLSIDEVIIESVSFDQKNNDTNLLRVVYTYNLKRDENTD